MQETNLLEHKDFTNSAVKPLVLAIGVLRQKAIERVQQLNL